MLGEGGDWPQGPEGLSGSFPEVLPLGNELENSEISCHHHHSPAQPKAQHQYSPLPPTPRFPSPIRSHGIAGWHQLSLRPCHKP